MNRPVSAVASGRNPPPSPRRSRIRPSTGAFGAQFIDQPRHVARGAAVVLVAAGLPRPHRIEARHADHADVQLLAVARDELALLLGGLALERDLAAREFDRLFRRAGCGAGRQHLEAHHRAALAADHLHHVIQAPADHVLERAILALRDGGDAVLDVQRGPVCAATQPDRRAAGSRCWRSRPRSAASRRCPRS